jgi:hypothetical protein
VAELGTDGPARRSRFLRLAWWTGPPPIPRFGPPRATNRMTRPPRRSPPQEAARRFWIRAWGQREPAFRGTGRLNGPARSPGLPRVGWTSPAIHAGCNSLRIEHPLRTLTHSARSRTGRIGFSDSHAKAGSLDDDRLPVMHQPVDQGRCQGVVRIKDGAPFPEKGRFVVSTIDPT